MIDYPCYMAIMPASIDHLPPVVQLLLREWPLTRGVNDFPKFIKRMLPELRRQAEWTMKNSKSVYPEVNYRDGLCITPSAGLDPFSRFGKCLDPECRILNANRIARTVGLYADVAQVGDPFTDQVLLVDRWSLKERLQLLSNFIIFLQLLPLFSANVFRFVSNFRAVCPDCQRHFESKVQAAVDDLVIEAAETAKFKRQGDGIEIETGGFPGTPFVHIIPLNDKGKRELARSSNVKAMGLSAYKDMIYDEVYETLFKMSNAPSGSVTFSNSRLSVLAARQFDTIRPTGSEVEVWEASRSASLPWVSELAVTQIVELRDAAHAALPRLRSRMARAFSGTLTEDAKKIALDLREEAAEVEAELKALDTKREGRFRTVSGLLGMTVAVYGFAGEILPAGAALTGLGSLLGLLHAAGHKGRHDVAQVVSRPGYVLVKAKELAEHATYAAD